MDYLVTLREQVNDLFSDFRKYIAPTYYHDRCERSLQMHLYVMHKRDILLTLSGFVAAFLLLLFIGFAGPNVSRVDSVLASEIFTRSGISNTSAESSEMLARGPFSLTLPPLSPNAYELCVWLTFTLRKEDESEAFHKNFYVVSTIEGLMADPPTPVGSATASEEKSLVVLLNETGIVGGGRLHHLYCAGQVCDPVEVIHLEALQYRRYRVRLTFQGLESVHEKYVIRDVDFSFQSLNSSFSTLTIWARFAFLLAAFSVGIWYAHALHRHAFTDWALEQKWTALLFLLLILYDNPLYPLVFLVGGSQRPRKLELLFSVTFYAALLLWWLCFYHGIRQNSRSWSKFYAPKFAIVGTLWTCALYTLTWSAGLRASQPTANVLDTYEDSIVLAGLTVAYFLALGAYALYLAILVLAAFTELRSLPYFDLRLKLQTFLMCFTLLVSILVCLTSQDGGGGGGPTSGGGGAEGSVGSDMEIPLVKTLPTAYETTSSAAAFMALFAAANLYVMCCAYFYHPSTSSSSASSSSSSNYSAGSLRVLRDNPTRSMINDSDEDVIYGSDIDDDLYDRAESLDLSESRAASTMELVQTHGPKRTFSRTTTSSQHTLVDTKTDEESD